MQKLITILIIAILFVSCSEEKKQTVDDVISGQNLVEIRKKKETIVIKLKEYKAKVKKLEDAISQLDSVKKIPLITTFKVTTTVFKHYLELQGSVETKNNLIVYPEYSGTLTRVYVKEGQNVSKGQTLAKIDDGGMTQQLSQLKIQTELAKTTFERQQRLWNQKIGSEMAFLNAKSNYEAQVEIINQVKQQISKTIVKAPFSGIIDDIITEQGSVVAAGQSNLMRIVNLNNMYIETDVPESHIVNVRKGKSVTVNFPILEKQIDTKIKQVGNYINPINRTFKIKINVPNRDKSIKPNLTAKLKINDYTNKNAILIPQSIISENANGEQYVYIVKDKTAKNTAIVLQKTIITGKTQGDLIEVLEGLENNVEVILEGARTVNANQTVEIKSTTTKK